jgi:iron complex outermembrane receptor protein
VLESPILKGFPVFDVDRVEVLRGPQGTLFGRDETRADGINFQELNVYNVGGTLEYDFGNGLTLQGGARYNDDSRDFTASRPVDTRPGFLGFGGPVAPVSTSVDANIVTWDASLVYAASDDINLFARAARGFRAPSIQGRLAFGRDISVADQERALRRHFWMAQPAST